MSGKEAVPLRQRMNWADDHKKNACLVGRVATV